MPEQDETDETEVDAPTETEQDESTTDEPDTFPRAYVEQLRDESARYRQRAGRADELHRRLVETTIRTAAADHLADPAELTLFAAEADLLDDDGYPDADLIVTAAKALVAQRPHLAPRRPRGDIGQGATATDDPTNLAGILRSRAS